jgi:hypothetical protein
MAPFDWRVGCGAFGRLQLAGAAELLIETIRFDDREAVIVNLADGCRRVVRYADAGHQFAQLSLSDAAAAAGMPEPVVLNVGGMARRVDPFHSERHLSERFRALTALVLDRSLPCAYGMLKAAAGQWDGCYEAAHIEDPEQTAGNVSETLARHPAWTLTDALRDQLRRDGLIGARQLDELLERTGWASVLADLAAALDEYRQAAAYPLLPDLPAPAGALSDRAQLTLL